MSIYFITNFTNSGFNILFRKNKRRTRASSPLLIRPNFKRWPNTAGAHPLSHTSADRRGLPVSPLLLPPLSDKRDRAVSPSLLQPPSVDRSNGASLMASPTAARIPAYSFLSRASSGALLSTSTVWWRVQRRRRQNWDFRRHRLDQLRHLRYLRLAPQGQHTSHNTILKTLLHFRHGST
jgi:hypothetical protein